ncbi:hypothetical protein [Cognatilysobacter bugurensis]|uniref:DUF3619 family protein n=1 Tax=Cognatilysobacter bugurensis TaxID=543356 RepID=A0A918WAI2_9GAMM|nr:hypothetical protein [Lysobacter bugurensis]GHA89649.1 hypothetical protein GCM10007067_29410 [Lysobacter bugurensis]
MKTADDDFDRAMRALHGDAVARLSPEVRERLRAARVPTRAAPSRPWMDWPIASGLAAVLVLAVALPLRPLLTPAAGTVASPQATASAVGPDSTAVEAPLEPTALVSLDESPDFYLWLASTDSGPDGALP